MRKGADPVRVTPFSFAINDGDLGYICGFLPGISLAGLPGQ